MNFLTVDRGNGSLALGGRALSAAWDIPHSTTEVQVGVRPEYVKIVTDPGPNTFPALCGASRTTARSACSRSRWPGSS
ncbi:hypothetical protein [Streptomyces sp. F001]|uniref:hypothetical protein n=1 Tax=Streptomyces sp. F001 TaxID=1510026 RepID=UPI001F114E0E|nr:hypothetical protein [Streptomyces sp. F001]